MLFLKRKEKAEAQVAEPVLPEAPAEQFAVKIYLMGRASENVRTLGAEASRSVPEIIDRLSKTRIELIEPLPHEYHDATPSIERFDGLQQWMQARAQIGPVGRHALYVLESIDALDMTVDTFVCGLLRGSTDAAGYPDYQAIVGGVATRWDEATGDLLARAVVGWGGRGLRGDTERHAQALVNSIHGELLASRHSLGTAGEPRLPSASDRAGLVCAHCGFETTNSQAFVCTRCGMRMSRGA